MENKYYDRQEPRNSSQEALVDRKSTSNNGSKTFAWGKDVNNSEIGHDKLV